VGLSVLKRACLSRGGPICPEVGLSVMRRVCLFRGGSVYPEAGLPIPRRARPKVLRRKDGHCMYRDTSLIRKRAPPLDHHRTLGIALL